ncbi:hypothetical protein [Clostridium manihotivorum]|uniref:ABC-2 family transporter protein n=1 Tax=Clostridium manihotivorum TaxID=2320868 RepID=A0A410DVB3_9CLOT|nr:hypothetical protein [Clostridium manihotivorum]QAA33000.1 hypothetical protein C1I91_15880 [Clostridium manihotivorum]
MRIIINELKKVLNIKSILILSLILFVMYNFFIGSRTTPINDIYATTAARLIKERGYNLEEKDLSYLKNLREPIKLEIDKCLNEDMETKSLGITSYEKLIEFRSDRKNWTNEKLSKLVDNAYFKDKEYLFDEIEGIDFFIDKLENKNEFKGSYGSELRNNRVAEVKAKKYYNDILPASIYYRYNDFICYSNLLIIVSIVFMLAPIFTKDKMRNVEVLQYTTKRGRSVYKDKLLTSIIATTIITTIELGGLLELFFSRDNKIKLFFHSSINSFMNPYPNWFDLNLLQFIICTIIITYIVAFAITMFICYISRKANRYITLIGCSVLLVLALGKIVTNDIIENFGVGNILQAKLLVPSFIGIITLIGIVLTLIKYKKERKLDIV